MENKSASPKGSRDDLQVETYRSRIYGQYGASHPEGVAPPSLAGLAPRAPYLRALIRKHFPAAKDATIMDLGCGYGALLHFAKQLGYVNTRGVDVSPSQVAAAAKLGIPNVAEGDLQKVIREEPDDSLDVIVTFDVLEHFRRDELVDFVDEVQRVLRRNGRWIIHVPNGASPFSGRIRYGDLTHELAFTSISLSQLLLSSGFTAVRFFEDAPVVHGLSSALRWIAWKALRGALWVYMVIETGNYGRHIFSQNLLAVATISR